MKIARVLLTIALALLILTGTIACNFWTPEPSEELELKIYDYLGKKYPGLDFEIKSYTHDTYTSGKYVFNVFCKTTEIDFLVYQSSFLTTDSYTVTYANLSMEEMLVGLLGKELMAEHVKSVQWLDIYADGNTGYKFREVDLFQLPNSASDIEDIHRITIYAQNTNDVLKSLRAITEKLTESGIDCSHIIFEWVQNDYSIVFTTDTYTLINAPKESLKEFLTYIDEAKKSDDIVNISFVSRVKRTELFIKDMEADKFIPGFNEKKSDSQTSENAVQ